MIDQKAVKRIVREALREDIGAGDVTTAVVIPANARASADIIVREEAVICGVDVVREVFHAVDNKQVFRALCADGDLMSPGARIAHVSGPARGMLTAERVALNFLGRLSGIATLTRSFSDAVQGTGAVILDTRKTTPCLRALERAAVRAGGGMNHRFDLGSMVLVKDNHRVLAGMRMSLADMVRLIRRKTGKHVQVEVDTLEELADLLKCPPDMILLDNMSPAVMRQAVAMVRSLPQDKRPLLEASGGIGIKNIRAVALSGVDRISIGALTHSARSIDVSFEFHQGRSA